MRCWAQGPAWGQRHGVRRGSQPHPPTTVPSPPGDTVPRSHPSSRPATQTERVVPLNTEEPLVQPWVGFAAGWGGPALWVRTLLPRGAGTHLSRAHLSSDCPRSSL